MIYLPNTFFFTSGQNSMRALLAISARMPNVHRTTASPGLRSLGTLQVFDRKLFPTLPIYRA